MKALTEQAKALTDAQLRTAENELTARISADQSRLHAVRMERKRRKREPKK